MGYGLQLIILSALCAAFSNLFMRRSIDTGGTTRAFLMIQLVLVFLMAILLNPVRTGNYYWSTPMALFGLSGGIILAGFMTFLGKALEHGPPSLTIAMLNSSTVMPILVLVFIFGSQFGYYYTLWNGLGSLLVVIGMCWAGWDLTALNHRKKWLSFVLLAFCLHIFYLVFLNWRALFINFPGAQNLGFSFALEDAKAQWFMPMVFLGAAAVQTVLFFTNEKRIPKQKEIFNGVLGGIAQGLCAYLMIWATEVATSKEHAMLFPIFSVAIILGCNIWGKWLYKEEIHWKGNSFCMLGLLIGTIDWKTLFLK